MSNSEKQLIIRRMEAGEIENRLRGEYSMISIGDSRDYVYEYGKFTDDRVLVILGMRRYDYPTERGVIEFGFGFQNIQQRQVSTVEVVIDDNGWKFNQDSVGLHRKQLEEIGVVFTDNDQNEVIGLSLKGKLNGSDKVLLETGDNGSGDTFCFTMSEATGIDVRYMVTYREVNTTNKQRGIHSLQRRGAGLR